MAGWALALQELVDGRFFLAPSRLAACGGDNAVLWDPGGMVAQLDALGVLGQAPGWQIAVEVLETIEETVWRCFDPGPSRFAVLGDEDGSEEADARSKGAFVGSDELEGLTKELVDGPVFSQAFFRAVLHETAARARYLARLGANGAEVRTRWLA